MTLGREVRDAFAACPEGYMLTFAAFLFGPSTRPRSRPCRRFSGRVGFWGSGGLKAGVDPGSLYWCGRCILLPPTHPNPNQDTTMPMPNGRKVLNALRHQRKDHHENLANQAAFCRCSTPCGINGRTIRSTDRGSRCSLGAQRLAASTEGPWCRRLPVVSWTVVLNALRHQRKDHSGIG